MKQTGALKAATHLFCFISFIGIYYPLTDIVIVHVVCNPSGHPSAHPSAHTSAYSLWAPPKAANVAKLIRRRRISLKHDNHLEPIPPPTHPQPTLLPNPSAHPSAACRRQQGRLV